MASSLSPRASARTWCGLAVLLLPALLVSMDLSVLFVAGPAITETLAPTATQWLWMMDVYGFVLAGLLITMGSLGDRIGRRRLLLAGAALFGAASAVVAFASSPETFVLARALLGLGGATLAPSTLSLIRGMFTDPRQRSTAVGAWTAAFSGGAVVGPVLGGLLLEHFWWGTVFLVNVPVMLLLLATAPLLVPEAEKAAPTPFDLVGALSSLTAVLALVFTMKHLAGHGPDPVAAAAAAVGAAAAAVFLRRQRRAAHPLVDVDLFRVPAFSASVCANTAVALAASGLGVLAFTFLQTVHGLSPLHAALWALPTFAGTLAGVAVATTLASRLTPAVLVFGGLLVTACGFGVVAVAPPETGPWGFIGGYTVLTLGVGVTATVTNSLILTAAPPERAGTAAGISETSSELGAALGIAVLGTVAHTVYRSVMTAHAPEGTDPAAVETVSGAVAAAGPDPAGAAAELLGTALAAYTDGVTAAALTGAVLLTAVAVPVSLAVRGLPRPD